MKHLIKQTAFRLGAHLYSDESLPTGVHWLHDIRRSGALGTDPQCFDVGANVGQTVAELRRAFSSATIHAFEPFSMPRKALIEATQSDRRVTVVPLAMGSAVATITAQPNPESLMSSLVGATEDPAGLPAESIHIDTIDSYCAAQDIESIDILKTDTEGYDLEVLRGAAGLLARQRVAFIYTEVTFLAHDRQHTAFGPVFDFLSGNGYRFLGLYETYPMHHFAEPSVYCNALFVSLDARERALAERRKAT